MTKINILHVAINYIRALESILDTGDAGVHVYGTSVVQSPNLPIHVEAEIPMEKPAAIKNPPKINPNTIRRATAKKAQQQMTSSSQLTARTKNPSSSSTGSSDSGINMDSSEESSEDPDFICPDWTELTSTLELIPPRGNLDTLLSSTADNEATTPGGTGHVKLQLPLQPVLKPDFNRNNSSYDLFSDLNSSFDSLESGMFIETSDPFEQLVVF